MDLSITTPVLCEAALRISSIVATGDDLQSELRGITSTLRGCGIDLLAREGKVPVAFASLVAQQTALITQLDDLRQRNSGLRYQITGLRDEIETRKRMDRARGIIARRRQVSLATADTLLRRQSRQSGRSLREVAGAVILAETMGHARTGDRERRTA